MVLCSLNYVFTHLINWRRTGHFSLCVNKRDCITKRPTLQPFLQRPNSERMLSPIANGRRRTSLINSFAVPISNRQIPTLISKASAPGLLLCLPSLFVQSLLKINELSIDTRRGEKRDAERDPSNSGPRQVWNQV